MANASKPRSRRRWYRTLQAVHLWVGLILCLPLVVLGEGLGPVWKWAVFLSGGCHRSSPSPAG